jgi:hypothetical protein
MHSSQSINIYGIEEVGNENQLLKQTSYEK